MSAKSKAGMTQVGWGLRWMPSDNVRLRHADEVSRRTWAIVYRDDPIPPEPVAVTAWWTVLDLTYTLAMIAVAVAVPTLLYVWLVLS